MSIPVMNASDIHSAACVGICHAFTPPGISSWVKPANIAFEHGMHGTMTETEEKTFPTG